VRKYSKELPADNNVLAGCGGQVCRYFSAERVFLANIEMVLPEFFLATGE
jgi:hypothetical protein